MASTLPKNDTSFLALISPIRGIRPKAILCLSDTSDIAQEIETSKDKKKSLITSSSLS
jgi:hypothetical protein